MAAPLSTEQQGVRATSAPPKRKGLRARLGTSETRTLFSDADLRRGEGPKIYFGLLAIVTLVFIIVFFFPLYWMLSGALKSPVELAQPTPTLIPHAIHWTYYRLAWTQLQIPHYLWNTTLYALGAWFFQIVFDVAIAYALSRLKPLFGKIILALILSSLMLPASALLVPAYLTVANVPFVHWNLLNTPWALWLPGVANAFNIYILKRFFDQIPQELLDAAAIDGAGRFRVLWTVVLPLSRPVLAVVSIFTVIGVWKDFLWPLLVLQDPKVQTINVALARLSSSNERITQSELLAGLVIASIPMVLIFIAFQRHILRGLAAGAIKG
jgi:multiple sugar transport system permease protein